MKKKLLLLMVIPSIIFSQEYIFLDNFRDYKMMEYTLETKNLYKIDKKINLYNIFVSKNNILLLSVLPELDENQNFAGENESQNWTKLDYENIKSQILTKEQLLKMVFEWNLHNTPEKKTMQYKLVKRENGDYYVSKYCLTEFFKISNIESPLISSYGVINVKDTNVSIKEMYISFNKQFLNTPFLMDLRNEDFGQDLDMSYIFRNYKSKEFFLNKDKAYQFWTFDGWWSQDGYNIHRGIDRFLYIPNKGIVGGSYDFYFRLKPKISTNKYYYASDNLIWENMINEKIMIAKEFLK